MPLALIATPPSSRHSLSEEHRFKTLAGDRTDPNSAQAGNGLAGTRLTEPCPTSLSVSEEHRQIRKLFLIYAVMFILPSLLIFVTLLFFPEAFAEETVPKFNFSTWQLGHRPELLGQ